jgi:hypothetical protein
LEPISLHCPDVRPWFAAYLGGRLGLTEWVLVEAHLAQCAECQRELRQLQASGRSRRPVAWADMLWPMTSQTAMGASGGIRIPARRLTRLARFLASPWSWMRRVRTEWSASVPMRRPSTSAMSFRWSVVTAAAVSDLRAAGWIVMTICRRARWWRLRAFPARSSSRPSSDLMTRVLRISTGCLSVVLVATLWCLRAPDRPTQSAQPATSTQTNAVPTSRQSEEASPPGQDVAIQSEAVPNKRPHIRRTTGSAATPKTQADIPMPQRIPAPSRSPNTGSSLEDRRVRNPDELTSEKLPARDPASVIDWLLRDEQRSPSRRERSENP